MGYKAIDTTYKGYKFRSRLEARWGVYFDAIGVGWLYEPEGFILPRTGPYLPDFFIEDWGMWVEIKGTTPKPLEIQRCAEIAENSFPTILIAGNPWPGEYEIIFFQKSKTEIPLHGCEFYDDRKVQGALWLCNDVAAIPLDPKKVNHERYPLPWEFSGKLQKAFKKARAARFEHGEMPA